jgi:uncharacterized protein YjbJ (UPF0337 family)
MNKDELKGKAENLKGRAKEALGSLTGNKERQGEGFIERVKGTVREKFGKAKREASSAASSASREADREASSVDRSVSRQEDDDE